MNASKAPETLVDLDKETPLAGLTDEEMKEVSRRIGKLMSSKDASAGNSSLVSSALVPAVQSMHPNASIEEIERMLSES